jgi:hypothetical protein
MLYAYIYVFGVIRMSKNSKGRANFFPKTLLLINLRMVSLTKLGLVVLCVYLVASARLWPWS